VGDGDHECRCHPREWRSTPRRRPGVPFYMVLGEHEARGRAVLANKWSDMVQASSKDRIVLQGSGHRPNCEVVGVTDTGTSRG
jgi:hypothetical protein